MREGEKGRINAVYIHRAEEGALLQRLRTAATIEWAEHAMLIVCTPQDL